MPRNKPKEIKNLYNENHKRKKLKLALEDGKTCHVL
jgi:hypothetical protein